MLEYCFCQRDEDDPISENRSFAYSNLTALLNYSATFSASFMLDLYLQYIKGKNPQVVGLILLIQPVIQAALSPIAGWISDKRDPRILASAGMSLNTAGLFLFSLIDNETEIWYVALGLSILGLGMVLFSSPNANAIMSSVTGDYYGIASGTLGTMRVIGQVLSMGFIMLLFSAIVGRVQIKPLIYGDILKSIRYGFALSTVFCFLGIFASLARAKSGKLINKASE